MDGNKISSALLLAGAGLIFLTLWAGQNFTQLATWLSGVPESASPALRAGQALLRLLLSIGLNPLTFPIGVGSLFWALRHDRRLPVVADRDHEPATASVPPAGSPARRAAAWLKVTRQGLVFLGLSLLFAITAGLAAGDQDQLRAPVLAVAAWVLGMVFALAGGWRRPTTNPGRPVSRFLSPDVLKEFSWPLAFTALSFVLRAWALAEIPIVLTGDEGSVGLNAIRFLDGSADNPFNVGWFSFPNLYFYLQSRGIDLLGRTIPALRVPSALAGSLTVGGVFLLARALFGRRAAIFSALLLIVMPYHVHFSRLGLNNVWDGLFFVTALGLFWRGWTHNSRPTWLLGGLAVGLSQYFYVTGRALPVLAALWLLAAGLLDRRRLRRAAPELLLGAWAALAAAFPLGLFYLKHPADFLTPLARVSTLGASAPRALPEAGGLERLARGLGAYTHTPLQGPFYTAGTPLLRALPATFFLVGVVALVIALYRGRSGRRARPLLLLFWLALFGLVGSLSDYPPAAQRYVAAAPAAALTAGWGLEVFSTGIRGAWPARRRIWLALIVLLATGIAVGSLRFYFFEYGPASALGGSDTLVADRLVETLPEEADVHLFFFGGDRMAHDSIRSLPYLRPDLTAQTVSGVWRPSHVPDSAHRLFFIFLPGEEDHQAGVRESYPGGSLSEALDFEGTLLFTQYEVDVP